MFYNAKVGRIKMLRGNWMKAGMAKNGDQYGNEDEISRSRG